jgi:hypothetical protein
LPWLSTATHCGSEVQETALTPFSPSNLLNCHELAPPAGLVEVTTSPNESNATHSEAEGQEIVVSEGEKPVPVSRWAEVQAPAPPAGSVDVYTFDPESTMAQNVADGHEMPLGRAPESIRLTVQAEPSPVGLVEVMASPWSSSATHSVAVGQERPVKLAGVEVGSWTEFQADAPPVGSVELAIASSRATSTHSEADGQDTYPPAYSGNWSLFTWVCSQVALVPSPGVVEVNALDP